MKLTHKTLLLAALGLAMAVPTFSQDDSSALFSGSPAADNAAPASDVPASTFGLELSGNHEFGYYFPIHSGSTDYSGVLKAPYSSNELGITVRDGEVKLVSNWKVTVDPLGIDPATGENGSWDRLASAKALENYLSWSPSSLKFALGYQIFSWGVADKQNPTDNLNPRDYSVGINADKIPVLAADAVWYPNASLSIEGVFVPVVGESIYPVDFKGEVTGKGQALAAGLAAKLTAAYGTAITVNNSVSYDPLGLATGNFVAGGKLSYRSSAFDASLSYLYDIDPLYTPAVSFGLSGTTGTATIALERARIHRFGVDAKTTLGKVGLWTEASYNLTQNDGSSDDYSYRRSNLNYVLGCDLNFGPNDVGYANIQYIGTWVPGYDDSFYADLAANKISDPVVLYERALVEALGLETEGLLQGLTANVKWEFADGAFTPQLTGVYALPFLYDDSQETRYGSLALNPELDIKPRDSFHIKLGANLAYSWVKPLGGSVKLNTTADKIGIYTPSNSVYLKVIYKWNSEIRK